MKTIRGFGLFLAAIALAMATPLHAADVAPDAAAKPIELFDGKTLKGWKIPDFSGDAKIEVVDGAIVMTAGNPMSGITSTRKDLPTVDYELSYEASRLEGFDFFAAATFPVGKSFITFVNGGWGGGVTGLSSLNGADASENETTQFVDYKAKAWHKFRIRVTGEVICGFVDDKQLVAVNYKGRQVGTRIETRENQPLGFATWNTKGAVRKIQIRPLTAQEIARTNKEAPES